MMQTTLRPSSLGALRARIRDRWTTLSDEDIARAGGSLDKLIEVIHAGTGEPRAAIKRDLRRLLAA
jgi:hypothetical protein